MLYDLFEKFRDEEPPEVGAPSSTRVSLYPNPFTLTTLKKMGWRCVGEGNWATAWEHPSYPHQVMKVFRQDPGYIRFYSLARRTNNPHFPEVSQIKRMTFTAPNGQQATFYVVLVEKLEQEDRMTKTSELSRSSAYFLEHGYEFDPELAKEYPEWLQALEMIKKVIQAPQYSSDVIEQNIRWRGNVPVIMDGLAGYDVGEGPR